MDFTSLLFYQFYVPHLRYTGRKEPMEHSAYYILTQCPDGVFEAVPVQAWYNFTPDIDYATLNDEEVEHEFSKRDRTLNHFVTKYKLGVQMELDPDSKVKRQDEDHGLVIPHLVHPFICRIFKSVFTLRKFESKTKRNLCLSTKFSHQKIR